MIRMVLNKGAYFALGRPGARLKNVKLTLCSSLTVNEKDGNYSAYSKLLQKETHENFLTNMENITSSSDIDVKAHTIFLKRAAAFYFLHSSYLKEFKTSPSFTKLCHNLCDKKYGIDASRATFILNNLCKLGVHDVDPLVVIRFWRVHIDPKFKYLRYCDIFTLNSNILKKYDSVFWKECKHLHLLELFKNKIATEDLKMLSTRSIICALRLMTSFELVDPKMKQILFDSLLERKEYSCLQILLALVHVDNYPVNKDILKQVQKHVFENVLEIPFQTLIIFIKVSNKKIVQNSLEFYDAKLVDAIVDRALWDNCDFDSAYSLMGLLLKINHKHEPLLDYLANKYSDKGDECSLLALTNMLVYAVTINYEQKVCVLLNLVLSDRKRLKSNSASLLKVTYYMALFEHYDDDLLESLFSIVDSLPRKNIFYLRKLINVISVSYPSFPVPDLPALVESEADKTEMQKKMQKKMQNSAGYMDGVKLITNSAFKSKLEVMLGGPMYLLTDIKVDHTFRIDYVAIYRKGGYPIAVNSNNHSDPDVNIKLKDISVPPNSQIIIFVYCMWYFYVLNTGERSVHFSTYLKSLKKLNHPIILVDQLEWSKLADSDRIIWLMARIKDKCKHIFQDIV